MKVTLTAVIDDDVHRRYLRLPPGTTGKVAVLQVGPPVGAIQLIEWNMTLSSSPAKRPRDPGPFVLAFELADETIVEFVERLEAHGVHPWTEIVSANIDNYGSIKTVIIEDPDGSMIEFMELPTRKHH